jgi:peptidoglycan/xylan/chitin deacetylase (PgdA/CDA1 family)
VTFDDGYADNYEVALPIMERYRIPATIFVASGYLDGGRMFNDAVIDAIASVQEPVLDLAGLGLGQFPMVTSVSRLAAVTSVLAKLRYLPPEERASSVQQLLAATSCGRLSTNIMLSSAQVAELPQRGVDIGVHTVTHNILTMLDDDRVTEEIVSCKRQLEALIKRPVTAFAYPNGRPTKDYNLRHVALVREAGFRFAVTTATGVADRRSDLFQLPRFAPWGESMTMLAARLTRNAWMGKAAAIC